MFVTVNGARHYFDVEGAGLVADGERMREKPVLLLIHGGPGVDHSIYKPDFSALSDIAQVVYLDLRGCGRTDECDAATWTLAQWGDDIRAFCDALGIEKPIVYGASFGGFVAQSYATRHPDHPARLILTSTAARVDFQTIFAAFGALGGPQARRAAEDYWGNPTAESRLAYFQHCLPLYSTTTRGEPPWFKRAIIKNGVALHFNGPRNEQGRMDFSAALGAIRCPTLVLAGDRDPIMPLAFSEEIVRLLPKGLATLEVFENCGHGVTGDAGPAAFAAIRRFILD